MLKKKAKKAPPVEAAPPPPPPVGASGSLTQLGGHRLRWRSEGEESVAIAFEPCFDIHEVSIEVMFGAPVKQCGARIGELDYAPKVDGAIVRLRMKPPGEKLNGLVLKAELADKPAHPPVVVPW